jgi:hypothetical protein
MKRNFKIKRTCYVYVRTSDLSNDTKKRITKSRETIPITLFYYGPSILNMKLYSQLTITRFQLVLSFLVHI